MEVKLNDIIKNLKDKYDGTRFKGDFLSNNEIDWLIQKAQETDFYASLFHTYKKRSEDYFSHIQELKEELEHHVIFLNKVYNGWEDQWNFEQLIKENEELTRKLNREGWSLICPKCKSDEDISYDLFYTENDIPYNGAYCHECNLMVWEEEHD